MINALLKLLGLGVRVAPVVKEILTSAPSTAKAPLSHADSERQAAAARAAGPRCCCYLRVPGGVARCELVEGHEGQHRTPGGTWWGAAGPRCDGWHEGLRCALTRGHAGTHHTSDGSSWLD